MKIIPQDERVDTSAPDDAGALEICLYLSYSYFFYEMAERINKREDEYNVDFEYFPPFPSFPSLFFPAQRLTFSRDTSEFALSRWDDILGSTNAELSAADKRTLGEPRDWSVLKQELTARRADPRVGAVGRRLTGQLGPLPRSLFDLTIFFTKAVQPHEPRMNALWGVLHLIIKVRIPGETARDKLMGAVVVV